jgi:transposase
MQVEALFGAALGLERPWMVKRVEFSGDPKGLEIWLDFPAGSRFACPECGEGLCAAYDTTERTWRHLNFFEHPTRLHARLPRVDCPAHGVKTVAVPWARPNVGFTLLMEAYILLLIQSGMTPRQVARALGEHDTRIWRIVRHYVKAARARTDFSQVRTVGVDETSRARGHDYITVFLDLAGPKLSRVLFACAGKDADTVRQFAEDFVTHGGTREQVSEVCSDMSRAYIKGVSEHLPQAALTFDRFHIMKLVNEAVDQVRRAELAERPELKGTRYLWLKNPANLTIDQEAQWNQLRRQNGRTQRAWILKAVLQDIYQSGTRDTGPQLMTSWCAWATRSRLPPMVDVSRTLRRHWAGVVRWFESRITNGIVEAFNGLIQAAKRRARGFRSTDNLIAMVYLLFGKLDLHIPAIAPQPAR